MKLEAATQGYARSTGRAAGTSADFESRAIFSIESEEGSGLRPPRRLRGYPYEKRFISRRIYQKATIES